MNQVETESLSVELRDVFTRFSSRGLLEPTILDEFYLHNDSSNNIFFFKEFLLEFEKEESGAEIIVALNYVLSLFIPGFIPAGASPQLEKGYTAIANEILEAMAGFNFSPYETRILCVIFRKTFGWHKKKDKIAFSHFEKATGLYRWSIQRTLQRLEERKIIVRSREYDRIVSYGFQKDYTKWRNVLPREYDAGKSSLSGQVKKRKEKISYSPESTDRTLQRVLQKKITKEKKNIVEDSIEHTLTTLLFERIRDRDPKAKEPNWKTWDKDMHLLLTRDGRSEEEVRAVIEWCQNDDFWQNNILSPSKLREKFSQLKLKMEADQKKVKQKEEEDPYRNFDVYAGGKIISGGHRNKQPW